jgi:hypothetical protein
MALAAVVPLRLDGYDAAMENPPPSEQPRPLMYKLRRLCKWLIPLSGLGNSAGGYAVPNVCCGAELAGEAPH